MTMRRATAQDVPAILALTCAAYAKWIPVIGRKPKPMVADYAAAVSEHFIDLFYTGATLAALIETIPASDHLLIENIAVAPEQQGKGYGRQLMGHGEKLALSLGVKEIRLYTNQLFRENVRFYLRLGYRLDREEPFSGGVVVYMKKSLC
ncbi:MULTISPECIES: GNAT family N-acetyltransferase [Sodalis]|jgi:GNAT superfamily N-acetyltransferase|uniref:N-acetylglutamate synthase-like GNAT family acetyltransferase n=1 Tax=Sodalis ligni TaxID=2697027 RepID=A0A4V2Q2G8_9GAMM|nr:GNAT family N-acetyltransferase [Sodalis ligni]TCL02828.1 N-acetylglutamate synthase-like GNAT family acetyltransferase [Sodalis ligni]